MLNDIQTIGVPLATLGAIIGIVWYANSWLNRQFSETKKVIFDRLERMQEAILNKMEYHERHDDQRFHDINNDVWAIKVRNAALDGLTGANHAKKSGH